MENRLESWAARLAAACERFAGDATSGLRCDWLDAARELAGNVDRPTNHVEETILRFALIDILLRLEPGACTPIGDLTSPTWIVQIARTPPSHLFDAFVDRVRALSTASTSASIHSGNGDDLAARAARVIEEEFADRLTVRHLARKLDCDPKRLQKCFRAEYQTTIHRYVDRVRAAEAVRLIIGEGVKVEAAALMIGLKSRKNLYVLVKRTTGLQLSDMRRTTVRPQTNVNASAPDRPRLEWP